MIETENGMSSVKIPMPTVMPLGIPVSAGGVQDVWDTFVKPDQDAENPQSIEMRILMGILRSVYEGLESLERGGQQIESS